MSNSFYGRELLNYLAYDKVYPSKAEMDAACRTDNISIGRNVIVKYSLKPTEISGDENIISSNSLINFYSQNSYELGTMEYNKYKDNLYFIENTTEKSFEFEEGRIYKYEDKDEYYMCLGTIDLYNTSEGTLPKEKYAKVNISSYNMHFKDAEGKDVTLEVDLYNSKYDNPDANNYLYNKFILDTTAGDYYAYNLYCFRKLYIDGNNNFLQADINTYCSRIKEENSNSECYHNTIWQKQYDPNATGDPKIKYVLLTDLNSGPEWEEI